MGKAIGYTVLLGLVLVLGTHPGIMAGMFREILAVLHGAGNQLASFINSL